MATNDLCPFNNANCPEPPVGIAPTPRFGFPEAVSWVQAQQDQQANANRAD